MSKRKTHTIEFKRHVFLYIFEDPENSRSSYAAGKKFKAEGHMVNKQNIHGWIARKAQIMDGYITRKLLEGGGQKTIIGP